jgi:amphi-Trp domain-containing protein
MTEHKQNSGFLKRRLPCRRHEFPGVHATTTIGDHMELELKEKSTMSREDAAARLRAIADELASGNDIILERSGARFVAKVPAEVALKIEFEVEDDETEFEIELTW